MRGLIAVVAVLVCCMADPLAPLTNLQSGRVSQQDQFDNQAMRLHNHYSSR